MRRGNTAARWKNFDRARTLGRRIAVILRNEEPDLGNRPGVEELFGFGDRRGWDGTAERFRWLAQRWLTR